MQKHLTIIRLSLGGAIVGCAMANLAAALTWSPRADILGASVGFLAALAYLEWVFRDRAVKADD